MGIETPIDVEETADGPRLNLSGEQAELLVRHRGEPLKALQHVVDMAYGRSFDGEKRVFVDALEYRKGKDVELRQMAKLLAEKAKTVGRRSAAWPAQPLRAAHRASRGGGSAGRDHRERRRRVFKDRPDLVTEIEPDHEARALRAPREPMFSTTDTIVAIATPPGRGGIGVVRLSGPQARGDRPRMMARDRALEPRHATSRQSVPHVGVAPIIDQVVAHFFPAPASYTGDDVVEIERAWEPGGAARHRAGRDRRGRAARGAGRVHAARVLNGRIDLMQAEAVADLIDAVTPLQARAAFDQLEGTLTRAIGEIDRRAVRSDRAARGVGRFSGRGLSLRRSGRHRGRRSTRSAIARPRCSHERAAGGSCAKVCRWRSSDTPNVGKSSLFNALVGARPRDRHGCSRHDAGPGDRRRSISRAARDARRHGWSSRDTTSRVESEGVARTLGALRVADLILVVSIGQRPARVVAATDDSHSGFPSTRRYLTVFTKSDLPRSCEATDGRREGTDAACRWSAFVTALKSARRGWHRRVAGKNCEALDVEPTRDDGRRSPTSATSRSSNARTRR